ncbi:MAG: DNA-binding protein [Chloroflexota bacterium]|nr:DNA-binding protein [Chloroflexota bacterium]
MTDDGSTLPASNWPKGMGRPAAGALTHAGITYLDQLVDYTEAEILALHGVGPKALGVPREVLAAKGLTFREPGTR